MKRAKRMECFRPSIFTRLEEEKQRQQKLGKTMIDFSIGSPDIAPARHIIDALCTEVAKPENYRYAIHDLPQLQTAIAAWYERRYQVSLDGQKEILTLQGSQEALANIALTICDPGD